MALPSCLALTSRVCGYVTHFFLQVDTDEKGNPGMTGLNPPFSTNQILMKPGIHTSNLNYQEATAGGSWAYNSTVEKLSNISKALGSIPSTGGKLSMNYMNGLTKICIPVCFFGRKLHYFKHST